MNIEGENIMMLYTYLKFKIYYKYIKYYSYT